MNPDSRMLILASAAIVACIGAFAIRAPTARAVDPTPTDPQIAEIVKTADVSEIKMAKTALRNAQNADVKSFAREMIKDHSANEAEEKVTDKKDKIRPSESETARTMSKDAKEDLAKVEKLKGTEFDKAYINAMVTGHRDLADKLEKELIPAAKDPSFKSFLEQTDKTVHEHLARAEKIQNELNTVTK